MDVLNRPILQVAEPIYTNARGAGYLGAIGLGLATPETLNGQVPVAAIYEPSIESRSIYDEIYSEFINIYRKNRGIYARLNRPARRE